MPALAFLAGTVTAEVGLRVPPPGHLHFLHHSEDGRQAVLVSDWLLHGWEPENSLGRAWVWEEGHLRAIRGVGVEQAVVGPQGSVLMVTLRGLSLTREALVATLTETFDRTPSQPEKRP